MSRTFAAVVAAAVIAGQANASTITWGLATDTTGPSSVSSTDSLVKAFDSGGTGATVNGVSFASAGAAGDDVYDALSLLSSGSFDRFDNDADLGDAGLDLLLRTGDYVQQLAPVSITLTGLVIGKEYELQVFFMDQRDINGPPAGCAGCNDRQVTLTSGAGSVTLEADPGNTSAAPFGQYVLGTFTADATTQAFDLSGPVVQQINAWQLRVPEPSAIALLAFGAVALSWRMRSNQ